MVKSSSSSSSTITNQKEQKLNEASSSSSSCKYKGVRKRKWGKYVSEIRLPNSRERIWLGSHDTAEKAARAFDAALFCLRGRNAKFNFPDNPPEIVNGSSMTPAEIQAAAARFANSGSIEYSGRVDNLDSQSDSLSSSELLQHESPCPSVSDEFTNMPLDNDFLDQFLTLSTENYDPGYGLFPEFNEYSGDFFVPPSPNLDYCPDNYEELLYSDSSSLWNF